jgi:hypothetical protein
MSRGPVRFREREASRAVRAAEKAGLTVERIEVSADGRFSLVTSHGKQAAAPPKDTQPAAAGLRSWDCVPRRKRFLWLKHYLDKHGRERLYFRKPGFPRIPLPGPYGGPEFLVAYYAALGGRRDEIGSSRTVPRSMNALVAAYYASPDFKSLRPSTARGYRNILERLREKYGDHDAAGMKSGHVRDLMDKAATPVIANRLLSLISVLMKHAIRGKWRDDNPAFGVERLRHRAMAMRPGASLISRPTAPIINLALAKGLSSSWRSARRRGVATSFGSAGGTSSKERSRSSRTRPAQTSRFLLSRSFTRRSTFARAIG